MEQVSCLGATHFKISHNGLDCFTWAQGQAQSVINSLVEHLWPGGHPDMNGLTVVLLHGGSDANMAGKPLPDGRPTVVDALASQVDANGVQNMIRHDRYEQMTI